MSQSLLDNVNNLELKPIPIELEKEYLTFKRMKALQKLDGMFSYMKGQMILVVLFHLFNAFYLSSLNDLVKLFFGLFITPLVYFSHLLRNHWLYLYVSHFPSMACTVVIVTSHLGTSLEHIDPIIIFQVAADFSLLNTSD